MTRYTVNGSILLTDLPLLERPAAIKAAGFDAAEFWWPFAEAEPAQGDVDAFVTAITDAGIALTGLNFFAGDMPAGDRGLVSWKSRQAEFRANIPVVVGIGERLGCRAFNALYGLRNDECSRRRGRRDRPGQPHRSRHRGAGHRRHRAAGTGVRRGRVPAEDGRRRPGA